MKQTLGRQVVSTDSSGETYTAAAMRAVGRRRPAGPAPAYGPARPAGPRRPLHAGIYQRRSRRIG